MSHAGVSSSRQCNASDDVTLTLTHVDHSTDPSHTSNTLARYKKPAGLLYGSKKDFRDVADSAQSGELPTPILRLIPSQYQQYYMDGTGSVHNPYLALGIRRTP
ncbi:hypothetical protein Bbelb_401540 [Branchiostoma belcheri]|nr:hypothetical protein Bbelb_445930 [Branchiostoma belcheri]KAI8482067.1 hypothetical protein Bbelb_401540 [Branchiostoma belcheri]